MKTRRSDVLTAALPHLRRAVGRANVVTDPRELGAAEQATYATRQKVPAIVRPADRKQVQACIRIANRFGLRLWPVSRGKNWGYGSRVPAETGNVMLDLGRMNRIVEVDEELAFARVEPGVTFGQLHEVLARRGSRLMLNVTGSTPDSSVLANALERGIGVGPYADRANYVCNLEVVLPDGSCVRTGFGRFPGAPLAALHRWGVGPALDGLFAQSNLGIVTEMTTWLTAAPAHFQYFSFELAGTRELGAVVARARDLFLSGYLANPLRFFNDYRQVAARIQFPWAEVPAGPLARASFRAARLPRWTGNGSVFFRSPAERDAGRAITKALLDGVARSSELFEDALPGGLPTVLGAPSGADIDTMYFRKRTPAPAEPDLDRDRCGVIWFSPLVPARKADLTRAVALVEKIVLAHRLEPLMSVVMTNPRFVYVTVPLVFDRDVRGEDRRAQRCHHALERALAASGYLAYRLTTLSMGAANGSDPAYTEVLGKLKRTLDPNGVLAPGRYVRGRVRAG